MPNLTIRNIPRETYRRLRGRAETRGRSLNAEILSILADEDSWEIRRREMSEVLPKLRRLRAKIAREFPHAPDSAALIREDRDSR
ncbi:MAG: FitA-like ribbon-helix-helix domain-containing protein [Terriglobia bacterium]